MTVTAAGARTPAASATGDGASAAGANASPSGASAPGAPDTWTWVWNWTGACLTAPASAPRAGWNWVWNWTCAADADPAAGTSSSPGVPGLDATPIAVPDSPAAACRRHADRARARRAPARRVVVDRWHGRRPAAARPSVRGRGRRRHAALLLCPGPKRRRAPRPPGALRFAGRARQPHCVSAVGGAAPTAQRTAVPLHPRPRRPAPRGLGRGRRGHRLRPPPDHGPAGRRVAGRPRRVELARRNGDPQRPGQDRPKDRSAGLAPSL